MISSSVPAVIELPAFAWWCGGLGLELQDINRKRWTKSQDGTVGIYPPEVRQVLRDESFRPANGRNLGCAAPELAIK